MANAMQAKVRKLAAILDDLRDGGCEITRLTTIKSLCQDPEVANRFVICLAKKALQPGRSRRRSHHEHQQLMNEAMAAMEAHDDPRYLSELLHQVRSQQSEYKRVKWASVRIIHDPDLLVVEDALSCVLHPHEAAHWAYQAARDYTERYDSKYATGLVPASRPFVKDIVDFWMAEVGIEQDGNQGKKRARSRRAGKPTATHRQGQFLAFIHLYRQLHRRAPSEAEMLQFFQVTPPSVHSMVVKLHELGLIEREPGVARSIRVVVPEDQIPPLEEVAGPPW